MEKRDRLIEMAKLAAERLSDHDGAAALWWQVLDLDPDAPEALPTLEKLTERKKDWEGLGRVLEMRVDRSTDPGEKAALLTKLGTVFKDRAKDPAKAADAWSRLLEVQPGNAKAMRSLKDAYGLAKDWEALEKLYADAEDYEGLVEVLGIAADRADDDETKIKLSFRCAELYDEPIGQPDRAVRHYERVLSVDDENIRAAQALVPIYQRAEKWSRLMGALEVVLDGTEDPEERVLRMDELRDLAATRMNNRALAFNWASRAFEEMPLDPGVREVLEASAEAANAFDELVDLFKRKLEAFEGDERLEIERKIANLSMERLGAVDDAVAGYRSILAANPNDKDALTALDEIFRSTGRWDDLVEIFERRIEGTEDSTERRDLTMEMARLYEEGMDKPARAAAHYRTVLESFPEDAEALQALERIFLLSEQWDELVQVLEQRRNLAEIGTGEWREISFQMSRIAAEELEDLQRAVSLHKELLETSPGDAEAIESMAAFLKEDSLRVGVASFLRPHLELAEDWRRLAWALTILNEAAQDRAERLALSVDLADVYELRMEDERIAFDTLAAALKENPADTSLWDRMGSLSERLGLPEELAQHLSEAYGKELDEAEAQELAGRLAKLYDMELGRTADAEPYYVKVLEADPGNETAFASLEGLFTSTERWDDLLGLYRKSLEAEAAAVPRLDLLLKVCFIVDEMNRDVPAAIDAYRAVLEEDPGNNEAVRALTGLYEEAGRWDDLSALLRNELEGASGSDAVQLRYRLGEIAEHFLKNPAQAMDYYEQVIEEDADHLRVQEALERLLENDDLRQRAATVLARNYEHQGAAEPLARVLMIALEDPEMEPSERVEVLTRVADLRERRLGDPDGAFEALSVAFVAEPDNEYVSEEISRVAAENGMESVLCDLLDEVIPNTLDDPALATSLMAQAARIYDERLGDLEKAEQAYRRLLEFDKDNPEDGAPGGGGPRPAPHGQGGLAGAPRRAPREGHPLRRSHGSEGRPPPDGRDRGVHPRAPEGGGHAVRGDPRDRRGGQCPPCSGWSACTTGWRSGSISSRCCASAPSSRAPPTPAQSSTSGWPGCSRSGSRTWTRPSPPTTRCATRRGPDAEAQNALARLYQATSRWQDLYDVREAQEPLLDDQTARAQMLFEMGDLLRTKLNDPDRAVEKLGQALEIDPSHGEARASLEALLDTPVKLEVIRILRPLCEAEGDYEKLLRFADIQSKEADDPLERSRVLREAAEVAEVGLEDMDRAFTPPGARLPGRHRLPGSPGPHRQHGARGVPRGRLRHPGRSLPGRGPGHPRRGSADKVLPAGGGDRPHHHRGPAHGAGVLRQGPRHGRGERARHERSGGDLPGPGAVPGAVRDLPAQGAERLRR